MHSDVTYTTSLILASGPWLHQDLRGVRTTSERVQNMKAALIVQSEINEDEGLRMGDGKQQDIAQWIKAVRPPSLTASI